MNSNQLVVELLSPYDVTTTMERVLINAAAKEWQNPVTHNLQQSLAKAGKKVLPVQVIELCKPKYSSVILEKNHERIASIMMPCRISIYEKEDGHTYVALLNTSVLSGHMPSSIIETMNSSAEEIFEIVKSVVG
jgi:uncharacterized protein (DUF302 family)